MEERFSLIGSAGGRSQLWTRDLAKDVRAELNKVLDGIGIGGVVIIDADGIEVFDFSFANELFGKSIMTLATEHPGRFLAVENLSPYTKENLIKTLESLNIAMLERNAGRFDVIGKLHPAYVDTFRVVLDAAGFVTANNIKDLMNINLTAANERLTKLVGMGLVRREKETSSVGRDMYIYTTVQ